jgi:flagellar hook-associated protein 1 FlgK
MGVSNGLMGIGLSGLFAAQRGLSTAGHNITNASTPGFSRQRVELSTRPPQGAADGFIGQGVEAATTRRVYDGFLAAQIRNSTANHSASQTLHDMASQIDNLLADPGSGLASGIQGFFEALHGITTDPGSVPARQVALNAASALVQRFDTLSKRLDELDRAVDEQLDVLAKEVNGLAEGIAALNRQIVVAEGKAGGQPANDLRDQRDERIRQLAERIDVTAFEQKDGVVNLTVGNGQPLVTGTSAARLDVVANGFDPRRGELAITLGGNTRVISGQVRGGEIAGLLDFRSEILDKAHNTLGRLAIGLSESFNAQHRLGRDLDGRLGGDFFASIGATTPRVLGHARNSGAPPAAFDVTVTDAAALTASDYRLDFDGAEYTLTRLSDNTTTVLPGTFPSTPATVDGLTIELEAGSIAAGDQFLIQPTRTGARQMALAVSDPRAIAAAADDANAGPGDNRNALKLAELQTSHVLDGGNATYEDIYGQLVTAVGNATSQADTQREVQATLLTQATNARESVSGVNLDEEAANLLRFQQAYQASAQFISVVDETLQTLFAVLGR